VATLTIPPAVEQECELESVQLLPPSLPQPPQRKPATNKADQFGQAMVLAILFAAPALMCVRAACVSDPDVWWHLRTGQWILQHHAVPHTDPFSWTAGDKAWDAYSWLFELVVAKLFQWRGLAGLVAYSSAMVLAITVALFHLIKRLQKDFSVAILLTFVAGFCLGHLYTPRPWMFTILLFILEMDILMRVRKTGRTRELLWLPAIFCLWTNVHIEFIDGLMVLGLALLEAICGRWWKSSGTRLRPVGMGAALVASVLATLINPYGWRVYSVVFDYSSRLATGGGALNRVTELQAIPFRSLPDFCVLFLAIVAAAALGWGQRPRFFEMGLLAFAAVVSFRSQRDIWLMAIVSAAILASTIRGTRGTKRAAIQLPRFAIKLAAIAAGLAVLAGFRTMHVNNQRLQADLTSSLPVQAVETIRAKGYTGPLYNDYDWGGYLMWAQELPVSVDGRASFYGDQRLDRSIATWNAEPDWASDPQLKAAGIVIGSVKSPLTQLLRTDGRFQLAYEDQIAAVFIARK
jgi:hypothetical protein